MGRINYTRWRRLLMQAVLCAIFAGSVGLAAIVTRYRQHGGSLQLGAVRWFNRVGVHAPAGWLLERENQGAVLLVAREPNVMVNGQERSGRELIVCRRQLQAAVPPEEYLKDSGLLNGTKPGVIDGEDMQIPETIPMAGTTGIVRCVARPNGMNWFSPAQYQPEWIACAVRPNGLALSVQLDCPNNIDPSADLQALVQIAAAIEVRDPQ